MITETSALKAAKILAISMAGCTTNLISLDCAIHSSLIFDTTESCSNFETWGGTLSLNLFRSCFRIYSEVNSANFDIN